MEELQSTDNLDREILEDARKKAWRILKTSDETIRTNSAEWEKKIHNTLDDLKKKYQKRAEMACSEIIARVPVEKRRIKAQVIDRFLNNAVQTWLSGLDRGYIISLLINELNGRLTRCNEFSWETGKVSYGNLSPAEVEIILRAVLPAKNLPAEEVKTGAGFSELTIENDAVRICASIKKTVDYFLLKNRAELIKALLGEEQC